MTRNRIFIACSVALAATPVLPVSAFADRTAPAEGTELYFISPQDGDTVESPIHVRMGLRGTHHPHPAAALHGLSPHQLRPAGGVRTDHHHGGIEAPIKKAPSVHGGGLDKGIRINAQVPRDPPCITAAPGW